MRVHVVGASGSGTTTLGRVLAARLGCPHFERFLDASPTDEHLERLRPHLARRQRTGGLP